MIRRSDLVVITVSPGAAFARAWRLDIVHANGELELDIEEERLSMLEQLWIGYTAGLCERDCEHFDARRQ